MIIQTHIMAVPFVLAASLIDLYLLLSAIRLLLGRFVGDRGTRSWQAVAGITDPLPDAAQRWLTRIRRRPAPMWAAWLVVFFLAITARQALLWVALAMS